MKKSKLVVSLLFVAVATGGAVPASAESARQAVQVAPAAKHEGYGVLKAVDAATSRVQIAHEAITTLNWSGMTMWFVLQAPLPKDIKVGDSVRFELEKAEAKKWIISKIERK